MVVDPDRIRARLITAEHLGEVESIVREAYPELEGPERVEAVVEAVAFLLDSGESYAGSKMLDRPGARFTNEVLVPLEPQSEALSVARRWMERAVASPAGWYEHAYRVWFADVPCRIDQPLRAERSEITSPPASEPAVAPGVTRASYGPLPSRSRRW